MTCPDCERYKISASMWRNKAYELSGAPLPWNAEELIEKAVLAEREACAKVQEFVCSTGFCRFTLTQTDVGIKDAQAIRARGEQ